MKLAAALLLASTALASAADLPPNARRVWGGWYECEPGYLMRGSECVAEADVLSVPRVVVSDLPSASDGAPTARSAPSRTIVVERPSSRPRWYSHDRYGGPYPDGVYDHLQRGTFGRVVPIW